MTPLQLPQEHLGLPTLYFSLFLALLEGLRLVHISRAGTKPKLIMQVQSVAHSGVAPGAKREFLHFTLKRTLQSGPWPEEA
jgi:hypothetical protein